MDNRQSKSFLLGEMVFTPKRMMAYIRGRARLASDEDIEDILQNALIMVTKNFDPSHKDANLSLYCLGACNKAIAQNLERYHKVKLRKRSERLEKSEEKKVDITVAQKESSLDGDSVTVKVLSPGKSFDETPSEINQFRTRSLDSMYAEDGRSAQDVFDIEYSVTSQAQRQNPLDQSLFDELVQEILNELPEGIHRVCFVMKYVEGFKREDLIECLKMEPKSIDTIDKKISRTLKAFKEKMEKS